MNQLTESERERERRRRKENNLKRIEKAFKEEENKWEKHEEIREKERQRLKYQEEDLQKKKKRMLEKDLNYDSSEEKKKIKNKSKYYLEYKQMRIKEREFDEMMRRKDNNKYDYSLKSEYNNQNYYNENNITKNKTFKNSFNITDLALKEEFDYNKEKIEKVAKSEFVMIDNYEDEDDKENQNEDNDNHNYNEDNEIDNDNNNSHEFDLNEIPYEEKKGENLNKLKDIKGIKNKNSNNNKNKNIDDNNDNKLSLNLYRNIKKGKYKVDDYDDENENDPYNKKNSSQQIKIDEETERRIMEISQEINNERKEEERREIQKQTLTTIISDPLDSKQKMIELQKQVFEMIPKEKESLFKYQINWNIVLSVCILSSIKIYFFLKYFLIFL